MKAALLARPRVWAVCLSLATLLAGRSMPAQQMVTETRDPAQPQDEEFAKLVKEWTTQPYFISPLVDHLPKVQGIPTPKDVLGYHVGAPAKLTYYADIVKYYRALAAATPRVKVETIGKSDEDRELVVVWVSSDENINNLQQNRDSLAKIADPRGLPADQIRQLIATTKPHYHLMGGLHSGETGTVRDADGARIPACDRDVAAHQADPGQRDRVGDARSRPRRSRSQRRLVLSRPRTQQQTGTESGRGAGGRGAAGQAASGQAGAGATADRAGEAAAVRGAAAKAAVAAVSAAVLGQVRLPRQQSRH